MSGYCFCACFDCNDVAITSDDEQSSLCLLCKDAGCALPDPDDTMGYTCQRDDTYEDSGTDDPEDAEWEQAARTGEAPPVDIRECSIRNPRVIPNVHYNPLPVPHSCDGYGPGYPCQICYPDGN